MNGTRLIQVLLEHTALSNVRAFYRLQAVTLNVSTNILPVGSHSNTPNANEIHKIIETSWPDDCLSQRRVQRLCKEFKDGNRDSFERKDETGKTKSISRTENVEQVRQLLEEDSTLTVQRIADK